MEATYNDWQGSTPMLTSCVTTGGDNEVHNETLTKHSQNNAKKWA